MLMLPPRIAAIVDELVPLVRQFARTDYGIGVGGAHAKAAHDAASDLDLYLFTEAVAGGDERTRRIKAFGTFVAGPSERRRPHEIRDRSSASLVCLPGGSH